MFSPTLIDYCAWCNSKDRRLLTARRIPNLGRAMICDECWEVGSIMKLEGRTATRYLECNFSRPRVLTRVGR